MFYVFYLSFFINLCLFTFSFANDNSAQNVQEQSDLGEEDNDEEDNELVEENSNDNPSVNEAKKHQCSFCKQTFDYACRLTSHMRIHRRKAL